MMNALEIYIIILSIKIWVKYDSLLECIYIYIYKYISNDGK